MFNKKFFILVAILLFAVATNGLVYAKDDTDPSPILFMVDLKDGGGHGHSPNMSLIPRDDTTPGQADFWVRFDVENTGIVPSGPFNVDLYGTGRKGTFWLGSCGITSVQPGGKTTQYLYGVVIDSMQSQAVVFNDECIRNPEFYELYWVIDEDNDVIESNEGNNVVNSDYVIVVEDPGCTVEFIGDVPIMVANEIEETSELTVVDADDFTFSPQVVDAGTIVTVNCEVTNRGSWEPGDYHLDYWASEEDCCHTIYSSYLGSSSGSVFTFDPANLPPTKPNGRINPDLEEGMKYYIGWEIVKPLDDFPSWPPFPDPPQPPHMSYFWECGLNNKGVKYEYTLFYRKSGCALLEGEGFQYKGMLSGPQRRRNEYRSFSPRQVDYEDQSLLNIRVRNRGNQGFSGNFSVKCYMVLDPPGPRAPIADENDYCLGEALIKELKGGKYVDVRFQGIAPPKYWIGPPPYQYPAEYGAVWIFNDNFSLSRQALQEEYKLYFGPCPRGFEEIA